MSSLKPLFAFIHDKITAMFGYVMGGVSDLLSFKGLFYNFRMTNAKISNIPTLSCLILALLRLITIYNLILDLNVKALVKQSC